MNPIEKVILALLLAGALVTGTCVSANDNTNYGVLEAARDLGNLNTFSSALEQAGFVDNLNNKGLLHFGNDSFIIFAPTDQAFNDLPAGTMDALYSDTGNLKDVLNYHIISNDDNKYGDLSRLTTLKTREGDNIAIDNRNGLTVNGARILGSRAYDHGIIYVIDKVLMPEKAINKAESDINKSATRGTGILAALTSAPSLSRFTTALESTDLVDRLNGRGTLGTHAGPFTIFPPNDAAFSALPSSSLQDLMANKDDLKKLISYHIVENTDVTNMTAPVSVKTIEGDSLSIDTRNSILVNGGKVISTRRFDNGIIYEIDRVLLPNDNSFLSKYRLTNTSA